MTTKKIMVAIAIAFTFSLSPLTLQAQEGTLIDGVAAIVGKNIVKYSDIERSLAQMRMHSTVTDAHASRCAILENLILTQLLVHKGEVDSVEVSEEQVKQYLDYYLSSDLQQYGSKEALREATGFSYDELKEQYDRMIRVNLLSRSVEYQITEDVKVTPAEVTKFFNDLPADSLPMMPEKYEISEIVIQPVISEAERDRVRSKLAELRERVIKGESFSMLATLYSQDPGSARKGGELGFFPRGRMVAEFESAAFALKPGEVSPIIETQFGFHIIQLIERRGNTVNARHILISPKVSTEDMLRARMTLDSLAVQIRDGKISFEDAARQYSTVDNAKQGGTVTNSTDGSNRFDAETLKQNYFAVGIPGMDVGEISPATSFKNEDNRDAYRIVRLNRKYPAHKANLVDDYDNIYNAALVTAKQKHMQEWARKQAKSTYIRLADEFKDCIFENLAF
ncbi:MAG: peptidylprolyl isomerase [Bacteroidales bacterium]|nr:peptidylprolyl isomerase [Bacteroidales bacterium]